MIYHLIDIWNDTIAEIGSLQGLLVLSGGMFFFVMIVNWTVSQRRVQKSIQRMNYERQRKAKGV